MATFPDTLLYAAMLHRAVPEHLLQYQSFHTDDIQSFHFQIFGIEESF